ncbi:MAG: cobalamin-dependent protein, partial [Candidatus Woesebacteria bacterium]|nr:cobalamin-dependent protein [Candidatus Woesebacteria bacterium]
MSSKEILFVHPPSPMLEIQKMVPPLGSLQLTAVLRQVGFEPEILDIGDDCVPTERLIKADHLLFSSTTPQYSEALKIIKPILEEKRKSGRENPIIAIGGPHATYMKEKLLKDGWNYVCSGDGEEIIVSLVEGKINKGLVIGKRVKDLNELPIPSYDILDPNTYKRSAEHKPTFPIMTSRGCPNNCAFCY